MIYSQAAPRLQPSLLCVTEVNLWLVTFISTYFHIVLHSFRHIGTKGELIGNIARTACGQNYINLLNHGINQDPKIYVSICWSNIRPLLHLFLRQRLLSSSLINVSGGFGSLVDIFLEALSYCIWELCSFCILYFYFPFFIRFVFCVLHQSVNQYSFLEATPWDFLIKELNTSLFGGSS